MRRSQHLAILRGHFLSRLGAKGGVDIDTDRRTARRVGACQHVMRGVDPPLYIYKGDEEVRNVRE